MGKMGKFDARGLKDFQKELENLDKNVDAFAQECAKELAARLLRMVIKRTPVGDYSKEVKVTAKRNSKHHKKGDVYTKRVTPSGKKGGQLRRGWTDGKRTSAKEYADSLKVNHFGDTYVIEISNPVPYASYVEYGHRTKNHKGWVKGHFMMTISEQELQSIAPQILEKKIKKYLGDIMK